MRTRLNREKATFVVGMVVLAWVLLKLGIFLAEPTALPTTPKVATPSLHAGTPDIRTALVAPPLGHYLRRGGRDPFRYAGHPVPTPAGEAADRHVEPRPHPLRNEHVADNQDGKKNGIGGKGEAEGENENGQKKRGEAKQEQKAVTVAPSPRTPLRLIMVVKAEGQERRRQAVVRHTGSGELLRCFEGDTLLGSLKLTRITADAVTLLTPTGRRVVLHGRFAGGS